MTTTYTRTTLNEIYGNDGEDYDILCDGTTYISDSKFWRITRQGRDEDSWCEGTCWNPNWGGWEVWNNESKCYGTFKTLKSAKQYIENWIEINPKDK